MENDEDPGVRKVFGTPKQLQVMQSNLPTGNRETRKAGKVWWIYDHAQLRSPKSTKVLLSSTYVCSKLRYIQYMTVHVSITRKQLNKQTSQTSDSNITAGIWNSVNYYWHVVVVL